MKLLLTYILTIFTFASNGFFLPLALLLSRTAKRKRQSLGIIALIIVGGNVLANFWMTAPSFHPRSIYVHWLDFAELIALGGFWFALFFYFLKRRPFLLDGTAVR